MKSFDQVMEVLDSATDNLDKDIDLFIENYKKQSGKNTPYPKFVISYIEQSKKIYKRFMWDFVECIIYCLIWLGLLFSILGPLGIILTVIIGEFVHCRALKKKMLNHAESIKMINEDFNKDVERFSNK